MELLKVAVLQSFLSSQGSCFSPRVQNEEMLYKGPRQPLTAMQNKM